VIGKIRCQSIEVRSGFADRQDIGDFYQRLIGGPNVFIGLLPFKLVIDKVQYFQG